MSKSHKTPKIPLPKGWKTHVRSAVPHVLSLAQYAAVYTRSWAADSVNTRVRLRAELDRVNQELLLLREEGRIFLAPALNSEDDSNKTHPPTTDCSGESHFLMGYSRRVIYRPILE